ncbi:hypothetical protein BV133_1054 [Blastochloris viridis]|uniref:Uncharacterized protein n=1 Tax=Blastochloris viridis TaxID=1079 RepID=A0A182D0Y9_BLAVI|nr:hypothetical protein BV133_1054 [Blastochloris viridis]
MIFYLIKTGGQKFPGATGKIFPRDISKKLRSATFLFARIR